LLFKRYLSRHSFGKEIEIDKIDFFTIKLTFFDNMMIESDW